MSVILCEEIQKEMFSTKKCLVYRVRLVDSGKTLRIIYKHCDVITSNGINGKDTNTFYFDSSFKNEDNARKAFEEVLDKLNMSDDNKFINFSRIINGIKETSNKLLLINN